MKGKQGPISIRVHIERANKTRNLHKLAIHTRINVCKIIWALRTSVQVAFIIIHIHTPYTNSLR